MAAQLPADLRRRLTNSLAKGHVFTFHYLSSSPAECDAIFAAPPWGTPKPTTWESQLLSVSIEQGASLAQVFAIEVLIYTTDRLITIFVSKADSTGYVHLANLPKTSTSPVQTITSAFLEYLIAWKRGHRRLLLSLFARSQPQYLFPGSVDNPSKHVLDDRQLIRWWSRIVDQTLAKVDDTNAQTKYTSQTSEPAQSANTSSAAKVKAYLVIPGLDAHETRGYIPRGSTRWVLAQSPLKQLALSPDVPERCLIPRFPDDPKARFALDLDDELPENAIQLGDVTEAPEPSKTGKWRSVRSLEQFWELMAFRQECAAGRVVGFLWAVFEPSEKAAKTENRPATVEKEANGGDADDSTKAESKPDSSERVDQAEEPASEDAPNAEAASVSAPPPPPEAAPKDPASLSDTTGPAAEELPAPAPPPTAPATALLVPSSKYTAITSLLEKLDYADVAYAKISSHRFFTHAGEQAGLSPDMDNWGVEINGTREEAPPDASKAGGKPENAPVMLVGRKRKKEKPTEDEDTKRAKANE